MNILGIGFPELLLIMAVGLFVLGPQRLMEGIREGKRMYTELKRQRDQLQALVEQAVELEGLKKDMQLDKLSEGAREIEKSLSLDQMVDVEPSTKPKSVQYRRRTPPLPSRERSESVPDIGLEGGESSSVPGNSISQGDRGGEREKGSQSEANDSSSSSVRGADNSTGEARA